MASVLVSMIVSTVSPQTSSLDMTSWPPVTEAHRNFNATAIAASQPTVKQEVSRYNPCDYLLQWSFVYRRRCLFALAGVGLIGNALAFSVLLSTQRRNRPSVLYLLLLAIFDSLVLVLEVLARAGAADTSNFACVTINYARYSCQSMSSILMVLVGIERCILVTRPFLAVKFSKLRYAWIQVSIAFIFSAASNVFIIWTDGINSCQQCNPKESTNRLRMYCAFLLQFIPIDIGTTVTVMILTCVTIHGVQKAKVRRQALTLQERDKVTEVRVDVHLSRMLVAIMTAFFLLRLPYSCTWLYDFVHYQVYLHPNDWARHYLMHSINVFITVYAANYAINCLIYLIFWPAFRARLWKLVTPSCGSKDGNIIVDQEEISYTVSRKQEEPDLDSTGEQDIYICPNQSRENLFIVSGNVSGVTNLQDTHQNTDIYIVPHIKCETSSEINHSEVNDNKTNHFVNNKPNHFNGKTEEDHVKEVLEYFDQTCGLSDIHDDSLASGEWNNDDKANTKFNRCKTNSNTNLTPVWSIFTPASKDSLQGSEKGKNNTRDFTGNKIGPLRGYSHLVEIDGNMNEETKPVKIGTWPQQQCLTVGKECRSTLHLEIDNQGPYESTG